MVNGRYCADLHVHSFHSNKIRSQWLFRHMNVAECYTSPAQVYALAKARGMDFVTITDHDTIDGALEIAHLEGAFVGVEVTTRFPEEPGTIHVVALGLTETQYRDVRSFQENIYDLVGYLNREGITHFLAHPFFACGVQPGVGMVEKLFLLFKNMEGLSGARNACQRDLIFHIVKNLTPDQIARWADRHGIEPIGPEPHRKSLVGASDDHAALSIARAFTACPDAQDWRAFLSAIDQGLSEPHGEAGTAVSLAASAYGVAYRRLMTDAKSERVENVFTSFFQSLSGPSQNGHAPRSHLETVLREKVPRALSSNLNPLTLLTVSQKEKTHRAILDGVNRVFNEVLGDCCRALAQDARSLNLESAFQKLGQIASAHFFLSAYYVSFRHQHSSRRYLETMAGHFGASSALARPRKVAVFSDCVYEVNGVAVSLRRMLQTARAAGHPMLLMTSSDRPAEDLDGVVNFAPVAQFPMPHYPEMGLAIPPILEMLDRCEQEGITTIQVSTPGPVGLAGLLIAYLLDLPTVGFYHTNLPGLIRDVTENPEVEDLVRVFTSWVYRRMDRVFVSSEQSLEDLNLMGVDRSRLHVVPRGVDLEAFHPTWRDKSVWQRFDLDGEFKLLYVGRMSREKNLDTLVKSFQQVVSRTERVQLIMVGDGPYRPDLERALAGYPACFTGTLQGEMLSKVYASSDLFVFPSKVDTFGNVVLEAQASGLPVVVADQGGARESVLPDITGVVVEGGPDAFADEIQKLLQNAERRGRMGTAARAHAERRGLREAFERMWEMYP